MGAMILMAHPVFMKYVRELSIGLLSIVFKEDPLPLLVVKTSKKFMLSAKVRGLLI